MSTQPDWRTLPKPMGTTHVNPNCKPYPDWYQVGETVLVWKRDRAIWAQSIMRADFLLENLVPINQSPQAWAGEGLPPVGASCKISGRGLTLTACHPEWVGETVEIIGHVQALNGTPLAAYMNQSGMIGGIGIAALFDPIRTPEQIAAEEREKAIAAMVEVSKTGDDDEEICAALYEAGYRKHDAQQLHELQASSEIHQANRELAEQRLRRLAEIERSLTTIPHAGGGARISGGGGGGVACGAGGGSAKFSLIAERDAILSHYREPQA